MMKDALRICGVLCLLGSCVNAAGKGNYSVQLMKGLAPAGWTPKQWAAAADAMIGKTQAHVCIYMLFEITFLTVIRS